MSEGEPGRSVTLRLPRLKAVVGVVVVAALIAAAVIAGVRTHDLAHQKSQLSHELAPSARDAIAAATVYAVDFATYTYNDLDAAFAKTESHSVDPFLSQYRNETAQLRATLRKAKASSTAKVVSAGIASLSATSAVVDIFLNQTITNSSGTHVDAQRVEMTLQRQHDAWLISNVVLP